MYLSPFGSDLFDAARLAPGQVDAEFLGRAEDVLVGIAHFDRGPVARQHLDVEAERLHFLDQDLEGLRHAWFWYVLALDDSLVHLDPAEHVAGLDGEHLPHALRGALRLPCPHPTPTSPLAP